MEQTKIVPATRLLSSCRIDSKDDFEEKFERCYGILQNLSAGLSEKEVHDNLNTAVCKEKTHEEVCLGLLMSILTQPQEAAKYYRDLTLVTRDGLAIILLTLNQLVLERYLKLNDVVRSQLLWLLREMIKANVTNVDNLCLSLLRHAAGGDISQRNICLIDALLDIFQENRPWLDKFPFLVASVVYTYLRLIEDHSASHLASLRQKEVSFMISLLREKTMDCLVIGRDLVRLLQNVARIPEFEILWKDLLSNPKSFGSNFLEILHLLQTRTSRRFLQSRLTPDMERKLVFLTSQVRFGNHKRYQEWFQRQYLATPESQTLRCDLIRFIVGVIHPTNELLCSDIIPRWAVIGWLFTTCTLPVAASNAKLALFYDWLFFESEKDNIMNIEPAILVMHNSMRSHPAVTATLLDFLCRIIPNFYPIYEDKVRNGIFSSLRQILEKRVLPSLYPLFDSPKLDRELRAKIRETFREFCLPPNADSGKLEELSKEHCEMLFSSEVISVLECNQDVESVFSDEEDDLIRLTRNAEEIQKDECYSNFSKFKSPHQGLAFRDDTFNVNLALGSDELKVMMEQLHHEIDNEMQCQMMERIVQLILEDEVDGEAIPSLASCLANTFSMQISTDIFPVDNINDETLVDSISTPLFVMFRNQFQLCKEEDNRRKLLARVLAELRIILPQTGYLLLYFLKIWGRQEEKREIDTSIAFANLKASVYEDFCSEREDKLDSCLLADLKQCHEDNIPLLCYLLPDIYMEFSDVASGNIQLFHLVVSTIDSSQLLDLVCQIMQGHLKMFKKDSFIDLLSTSLNWESFEQYCFWQLVLAHDCPIDHILPILPKLQYEKHAEALNHILSMLKKEKPSIELLKQLLTRQCSEGDTFVLTALKYWHREHQDKLGEFLATILSTRFPTTSPNKRKRSGTKYNQLSIFPTGEQVLGHLDIFRQHCTFPSELQLYHSECMQKALQQAQIASNDSLRKVYGDLFAFAEVNEENDPSIPMAMTASARKTIQGTGNNIIIRGGYKKSIIGIKEKSVIKKVTMRDRNTESSDLSSEEEEIMKPKQARKRKKLNPVHSDSD